MNKFLLSLFASCLVVFSVICFVNATLKLSVEETMYEYKTKNILKDISNNFAVGQFIHIVISEDNSWSWGDLLRKDLFEKWSIAITSTNKQVNTITTELPDVYVIMFKNYQSLIQLCNILRNVSESWNPGAKFMLITSMTKIRPKPLMDKFAINIFNGLWSRNIIRVSLVIFNKSAKTASLFSSSPYSELYKTCKKIVKLSQLQEFDLVNNQTSSIKIAGYQFESPKLFLGCPLIAQTFPFPPYSVADTSSSSGCRVYNSGIEVEIVKLLGNVYNFSLEILTTPNYGNVPEWLYTYPNGTRKGMLEDIMQNKIDLAFAGVIPASAFYFRLSFSRMYMDSSLSWYVPGAKVIPIWKLVLNTFFVTTWLFMLSLLFIVAILYYSISGSGKNEVKEPVDLTMLALSLGFSIQWTKKPYLRIVLVAWSLFCFHVALMFNTRLFSVLTEPPFDSQIETIENLRDSHLKPCTLSSYRKFYAKQTNGIIKFLVENADDCEPLDEAVKDLLKYRNISILAKDDYISLKIDTKIQNIHQLKNHKFINYPVGMPVGKGSVFLEALNRLIFNITEAGLIHKWMNDVHLELKINPFSREGQDSDTGNESMKSKDFVWLYFVFLGGQAMACIVFLIEIYINHLGK